MSYLSLKRRRDLARRKWQYGAVLVTVVLGVMLYASSYDAYRNLDGSYKATYERLDFADMTVTGAREGFADDARAIPGVKATEDRLVADTVARVTPAAESAAAGPGGSATSADERKTLAARLVAMPGGSQPAVNRVDVERGDYLDERDSNGVLLEYHFAEHFGLEPGDRLELFTGREWASVHVRGVVVSAEYLWPAASRQNLFPNPDEFGVVFVTDTLAEALPAGVPVPQTLVRYAEGADVDTVDRDVKLAARRADASDTQPRAQQPSNEALQLDVQGFEQMAYLFPGLFLLAAGLAVYMLLTRLVFRERAEIGTLRANGVSRSAILRHYLSYGVWIGLVGSIIGVALGVPLGWLLTEAYTAELGIPDTLRSLYPLTPVVGLAFGLVAGVLSSLVPARMAASVPPAEAMRGEVPVSRGHVSLFERLVPSMRRLPVLTRMVLRGIGRNHRRSVTTVVGVVLSLMLVLTSWGMIDTTVYLMDRQFNEISLEDATVVFNRAVSDSVVRSLGQESGVESAERIVGLGVTVKGPEDTYATQLQGFRADTAMHRFEGFDSLPSGGVVVGSAIGEIVGAKVGDTVTIDVPAYDTEFDARVLGFVDEPLGTFVYAERGWLESALAGADPPVGSANLRGPTVSFALIKVEPGADRAAVFSAVKARDDVATTGDSRVIYNLVIEYLGLFYAFVGIMLLFGGIMAFALIFNIMSVNFAERAVEIATMRANGFSRRTVAGLVVAENVLLTALAIPIGLGVGYASAAGFMASYSTDLFSFDLYVSPWTYVLSCAFVFAITGIALLPGIRSVGRIDIGGVVRERSQ